MKNFQRKRFYYLTSRSIYFGGFFFFSYHSIILWSSCHTYHLYNKDSSPIFISIQLTLQGVKRYGKVKGDKK